jgi:hypothetical protein
MEMELENDLNSVTMKEVELVKTKIHKIWVDLVEGKKLLMLLTK